MDFFDSLINDFNAMFSSVSSKEYSLTEPWRDMGENSIILRRDTAFELEGTGFNLITGKKIEDGITVIGDDLSSISENRNFARISLVQIDDAADEQKLYNLIKKIEYVKYHVFPEGYMIRTASRTHKEAVRVSKNALKNAISFSKIGSLLIKKYKEIPSVKAVRTVFITDKSLNINEIEALAQKNSAITETFNHIMNNVRFDCDSCDLKAVCDEVEGMKELHFKTSMML